MNTSIEHFIITQFNLKLWDKDKLKKSTLSEEWLSNRMLLFKKYCLPSVINQTNKNFKWICLFDEHTPKKYLDDIEEYREKYPQIQIYLLNEEETQNWLNYTRTVIKENTTDTTKYIITSNLDNDDALHKDYVNKIQDQVIQQQPKDKTLYSFVLGYQYFTELDLIFKLKYPHNHFLSLVELVKDSEIETIRTCSHAKARKIFNTIDIYDHPYWIEFVHNKNVNNDLRITSRIKYFFVTKTIYLDDFSLDIRLRKINNITKLFTKFPKLFLTTAKRKLSKKIKK